MKVACTWDWRSMRRAVLNLGGIWRSLLPPDLSCFSRWAACPGCGVVPTPTAPSSSSTWTAATITPWPSFPVTAPATPSCPAWWARSRWRSSCASSGCQRWRWCSSWGCFMSPCWSSAASTEAQSEICVLHACKTMPARLHSLLLSNLGAAWKQPTHSCSARGPVSCFNCAPFRKR